jgi:carboxyl-terminal processing protease
MGVILMKKRFYIFFVLLSGIFLRMPVNAQFFNEQGLKFVTLFNWIENHYVDSLDLDKISDITIRELLKNLDPHSVYFTKEEVAEMNEPLQGNFDGIGVSFNIYKDTILVISSMPGGPSEQLGIQAGDRIIFIENENVAGIGITKKIVQTKLRGKKGSKVTIQILRRDSSKLLSFTITRDKIPIESVDASYQVDKNTGYVRLSRFSATTTSELNTIFKKFKASGIENIILDLSGNGGGFLDIAVSLADQFLEEGRKIVYTQGLHSAIKEEIATKEGLFEKGKLVIIIDEYSASASEIVTGAIQDWDRGVIIGRRSYGKGLVQRQFTFPDGSMVRLTISRYYTPSGRLIQKSYSNGVKAYSGELNERVKNGEVFGRDQKEIFDSTKYFTLLKNRVVFGGGGIAPDVYVPLDTTIFTDLYRNIQAKGLINSFVLEYIDKNRASLKSKFETFDQFKSGFVIDNKLLESFVLFAADNKVTIDAGELKKIKVLVETVIKANIAMDLWSSGEFYEIYNTIDPDFIKAKEVIKNWNSYLK